MTASSELPEGWVPIDLSEVGELHCGQSPSRAEVNHEGQGTLYVTGPEQWNGHQIVEDKWTTNPKRIVPDGCIFITVKGAGVGKLFPGVACAIGRDVYAYKPHGEIPMDFVRLALKHSIEDLKRQAVGDIPGLSKRHILGHPIGFPPLNEQRRIVAKIEELTARSRNAKQALDAIPPLLERFRQSVLAAAFRGDLTKQWRQQNPNTEPASELLKRIRQERRHRWEQDYLEKQKAKGKQPKNDKWKAKYKEPEPVDTGNLPELPEGWCWTTLDELSNVVRGASPRPAGSPEFFGGEVPWITVGSLTAGDSPYLDGVAETLTEKGKAASRFVEAGTLLLTNSGATLGVPRIINFGGCINDGSVALQGVLEEIKLYLYYYLTSQTTALRALNQGAAQPNLNTTIVRGINVPLPPFEEALALIKQVESLFAYARAFQTAFRNANERTSRIDQSILAKAFRGELVPQDSTDEPASTLLEHIRT